MKNAKYFDITDENITPAIYILLFCNAYVELTGNDTWYRIYPLGKSYFNGGEYDSAWEPYSSEYHDTEKCFQKHIKRGYKNCYYDEDKMKSFIENPCTCAEAVEHFKKWLIDQGVSKEDALFVKIWW